MITFSSLAACCKKKADSQASVSGRYHPFSLSLTGLYLIVLIFTLGATEVEHCSSLSSSLLCYSVLQIFMAVLSQNCQLCLHNGKQGRRIGQRVGSEVLSTQSTELAPNKSKLAKRKTRNKYPVQPS